ncbi:hypothetical protein [Thiorhodovibrio litoralis]|uniref:hypothetical protein n=1 Tax=Thiorhodovibrio litoralis TaxID=2952932 RepID=UPI002B262B04|nr:hypothetical protein [Thiorhodovibrio litoralis]
MDQTLVGQSLMHQTLVERLANPPSGSLCSFSCLPNEFDRQIALRQFAAGQIAARQVKSHITGGRSVTWPGMR